MRFGGDLRSANAPLRADLAQLWPEGAGSMLDWLSEPAPLKRLGEAIGCTLSAQPEASGGLRRFAARPRGKPAAAGGDLLAVASLSPATAHDLRRLTELAGSGHAPYAAVLVAPSVNRTMRSRMESMHRLAGSEGPFLYAVELAVTEVLGSYAARLRLVAGHACFPEAPSQRHSDAQSRFWLQLEDDLARNGLPGAHARDDGSGLVVSLGWPRNGVAVCARMLNGELAALAQVSLASPASAALYAAMQQELERIAEQAPALRELRCERLARSVRLVAAAGKPANRSDPALWQEFRPQLVQAVCGLVAAMQPLVVRFKPLEQQRRWRSLG